MLFKKQGFPEEGDLVLCTVTSVQFHSVFIDIDEYGKSGLIHISEVAPGRIRNIRDFVKEGKKVVCKVLRINKEKGYIDLSLRRVNESEKRRKIDSVKRQQNAEKILEIAAGKLGIKIEDIYNALSDRLKNEGISLYELFEQASKDETVLDKPGMDKKQVKVLNEIIALRIKPSEVQISGNLKITTYAPNGIDIIKDSLKKAEETSNGRIKINYLGSGLYRFMLKAPDYKDAEKVMKNATETAIDIVAKQGGFAEFIRDSA